MEYFKFTLLLFFLIFSLLFSSSISYASPSIVMPNFEVKELVTGLNFPVQMGFVGNDLLILQKNNGQVRLVRNDILQNDPVLTLDVYNRGHLGLLGITSMDNNVFLYVSQNSTDDSGQVVNRIYRYVWDGDKLNDQKLINELPTGKGFDHSGGVLTKGLDNSVYAIIGDTQVGNGILQNTEEYIPQKNEEIKYDDTSIILRVGIDPEVTRPSLSNNPIKHYFGMGIRNSFGITADPVTGFLWDTENGEATYDEINLVMPNFNSGWKKIMGPATQSQIDALPKFNEFQYSDPEFSWEKSVAPTALAFVGKKWSEKYADIIFVGDFNTGTIYKFKLNSNRTNFDFNTPELQDLVANTGDPIKEIIFGTGFIGISDIEIAPDGSMYLLSFKDGGTLYKISQSDNKKLKSPLKQLKDGLSIHKISCLDGHVIIAKISTDSVACVGPRTASHLIEQQWGNTIENPLKNCFSAPKPKVDWNNCNFSFGDLSNINLEGVNLSGANLVGTNFSNSVLTHGNFLNSNMVFTNFSNSDLSHSNLETSQLLYSNFHNSTLISVIMTSTNLSYADFTDADLRNSSLAGAYFTNANLSSANLSNASLVGTILHFANMMGADLSNSELQDANFYLANMSDANFTSCKNHEFCN